MRYCPDCDKWLPVEAFYVAYRRNGKPFLRGVCKMHYNLRCTYPGHYGSAARKPLGRSTKSHRRSAFARILERL